MSDSKFNDLETRNWRRTWWKRAARRQHHRGTYAVVRLVNGKVDGFVDDLHFDVAEFHASLCRDSCPDSEVEQGIDYQARSHFGLPPEKRIKLPS